MIYMDGNYRRVTKATVIMNALSNITPMSAHRPGVAKGEGDHMVMFVVLPGDALKQYNMCINTWSLRHLTSAEEYPDEEYLDMSKSSSLKDRQYLMLNTKDEGLQDSSH